MDFGKILKGIRKDKGLKQREMAKILNISRSYYSDLECNRYFPSSKLLLKMNKYFDIFYLINNDGNTIHYGGEQHVIKDSTGRHIGK